MKKSRDLGILVRVVLSYLAFSVVWILLSDVIVESLTTSAAEASRLQTYKGLFFVLASALVFFLLLRRELSARREAESLGSASEDRFRTIFDSSADALFVLDTTGRILEVNAAAMSRYGYSRERLLSMTVRDLTPERLKSEVTARLEAALQGDAQFDWVYCRVDGTEIPVEIGSAQAEIGGRKRIFSTVRDISQRKRTETELRQTSERLALAATSGRLGIWDWDLIGNRMFWDDRMCEIHGIDSAPTGVIDWTDHLHPEDRSRAVAERDAAVEGFGTYDSCFRVVQPGGAVVHVKADGLVIRDEGGRPIRMIGIHSDVTERKELELELARHREHLEERVRARTIELETRTLQLAEAKERAESADRLKSAFLATMSHELRTPLNSVIGFTGILLQEIPGTLNAEQRKQLGIVQGSARHLLALINDVLDISKIEAGQLTMDYEPFEVEESIRRVASSIEGSARAKGLSLSLEVDPTLGVIVGDRRRYEQVLLNLLSNAVKFTMAGAVSVTACRTARRTIELTVRDTGIGISDADQEGLFQPFHQVETGLSRKFEGTGLGLSISRRLVDLMGGTIWVDSELGVGSTFGFCVPTTRESEDDQ